MWWLRHPWVTAKVPAQQHRGPSHYWGKARLGSKPVRLRTSNSFRCLTESGLRRINEYMP
jgi:hypothetical protein